LVADVHTLPTTDVREVLPDRVPAASSGASNCCATAKICISEPVSTATNSTDSGARPANRRDDLLDTLG